MTNPKVCVVLGGNTVKEVLKQAELATAEGAELVEVRFDRLYVEPVKVTVQNIDGVDETSTEFVPRPIAEVDVSGAIQKLKKGIHKPVLFTCRPSHQDGDFPADEKARIAVLREAIESGVSWIDLELDIEEGARAELLSAARESGATVVASAHLESTPEKDEIIDEVTANSDKGDIIKLCYNTRNHDDALTIFEASWRLKDQEVQYSIMGRGIGGDWTRLHAPLLNQELVFATLRRGFSLADKGLINIRDLTVAWKMLGHTE